MLKKFTKLLMGFTLMLQSISSAVAVSADEEYEPPDNMSPQDVLAAVAFIF